MTDLDTLSWGLLNEKLPKSILRVTIFLLIGILWWILCLPWHKGLKHTAQLLIATNPVMLNQGTTAIHYFSISTCIYLHQYHRKVPSLMCSSSLQHSDRQKPFTMLFPCQTQLHLLTSYVILRICPTKEISVHHCATYRCNEQCSQCSSIAVRHSFLY